jgi:hypothetical protein
MIYDKFASLSNPSFQRAIFVRISTCDPLL